MKSIKGKLCNCLQSRRINVLFNHFIDKDLQSMLQPLNFLQSIKFCPKYRITNNFIAPNSRLSNCVSLCGTISFLSILIYHFYCEATNKYLLKYFPMSQFTSYTLAVFFNTGLIVSSISSVMRTNNNVSFILKFQDVHRFLNKSFKYFTICSWVIVTVYLSISVFCVTYFALFTRNYILTVVSLIIFSLDIDIIYATRLIQLLKDKVDLWNIHSLQFRKQEDCDKEDHCKIMFQAYVNILQCYEICWDSFQHVVREYDYFFLYTPYLHIHTAKEIRNQTREVKNHIILVNLTNTHVNLLNIKQNFSQTSKLYLCSLKYLTG